MFLRKSSFVAVMAAAVLLMSPGSVVAADTPADDPPKPETQPRRDDGQAPDLGPMMGQLERFQEELDLSPEQMEKLQGLGMSLQEQSTSPSADALVGF